MHEAGLNPMLFKVGSRTEAKSRSYGRGISYQNVSAEDAVSIARNNRSLIACVDKNFRDVASAIMQHNATVCVHDPTELKGEFKEVAESSRVIVIREKMLEHLPAATFIKHPYRRYPKALNPKREAGTACAISRVDFDKNTLMIAQANEHLAKPVHIYGFRNRLYEHFKIEAECPNWIDNYKGLMPAASLWSGVTTAANYAGCVDLSVIKGDGGGTQYTFLEALDAGTWLVVHSEWGAEGLLADCSHAVSSVEELCDVIRDPTMRKAEAAITLLDEHNAAEVARKTSEVMNSA